MIKTNAQFLFTLAFQFIMNFRNLGRMKIDLTHHTYVGLYYADSDKYAWLTSGFQFHTSLLLNVIHHLRRRRHFTIGAKHQNTFGVVFYV